MKATSLLFFSSSPIALPLFEALLKDERFVILGLVCQPDKPTGRGQELTPPATKVAAERHGVPVFQPEKLSKDETLLERFRAEPPDFLLTFAYGQLLSAPWLALAKRDPLNVHPSLLPKYRGPAPLEAALLNGEKETGITLMKMAASMDSGPIAFQKSFSLGQMTAGELYDAVALRAAEWIPDAVFKVAENENFEWKEQDESRVTLCSKLSKEDSFEDFKRPWEEVLRRHRAYTPWPGLWSTLNGKRVKLLRLQSASAELSSGVVEVEKNRIFVGTADGSVEILELQMEGKKATSAAEFLRGNPINGALLPS